MNYVRLPIRHHAQKITLRDLVKPELGNQEQRAVKRALKAASRDQDLVRKKAKKL